MLRKKIAVIVLLTFESIILVLLVKPFKIQETAKIVDGKKTISRKLCVLESVAQQF